MGAISSARANYGLSCVGTPAGTNTTGTLSIGASSTTNFTASDIGYSFKITSVATGNVARLNLETGAVSQQTGTPTITDGDGKDFEGVTLPTAVSVKAILIRATTITALATLICELVTSDFAGTPRIEFPYAGECLLLLPMDASGGIVDFTFGDAGAVVEVVVIAQSS